MKRKLAIKFAEEVVRKLPPLPSITDEELLTLRWWTSWIRRSGEKREFDSFKRATEFFHDATGTNFCDFLPMLIEKQKKEVAAAFAKSAYLGKAEESRLEKYLGWKALCQAKEK